MNIVEGILIGFIIGKFDIIWKHFFGKNQERYEKLVYSPLKKFEPQFEAQIVNNKYHYTRGENIQFKSKYKGKLKNGYFANELFPIAQKFHLNTPFINEDGSSVMSYCFDTIENIEKKIGKIDGVVDRDWIFWEWLIPIDAPLKEYTVKMMVFNEGEGKSPVKTLEGKFEVIIPDTSNSLYNKPNFK